MTDPTPPLPAPSLRPGGLGRRGVAFFIDSTLFASLLIVMMWILQQPQPPELVTWTLLGMYRVMGETFWGATPGKGLLDLKVFYSDPSGQERSGIQRFGAALLRNSWLLVGAAVWLWQPDHDLGGLMFLIALTMLFSKQRKTLVDQMAGAWVVKTVPSTSH